MKIVLRLCGALMLVVGIIIGIGIILVGGNAEASGHFLATFIFVAGNIAIGIGLLRQNKIAQQSAIGFGVIVILANFLSPYGWKQGNAFFLSFIFYVVIIILSTIVLNKKDV